MQVLRALPGSAHRMDRADGELCSADFNDLDWLEPYVCCLPSSYEPILFPDQVGAGSFR